MRVVSILSMFVISCVGQAFAQAPKYSNEFMAIGVGARNMSLGGATFASVNDATATYWNPAGILNSEHTYMGSLMHAEYFGGIANYDYGAFVYKLDERNAVGISFIRLGIDDIPNTLNLYDATGSINYNNISLFSAADYALTFSYAHQLENQWRVGANAKVIRRLIGPFADAWGFGVDVGAQRHWNRLRVGIMLRDITTTFNAWNFNTEEFADAFLQTGNELPEGSLEITLPRLSGGLSYLFNLNKQMSLRPELAVDITTDGARNNLANVGRFSIDPRLGAEFGYMNLLFVRAGLNNVQRTPDFDNRVATTLHPNLGVGLKFRQFSIDYAITNVGDRSQTLFSNILSLAFAW
jgi:hypothetical protein